MYTNQTKPSTSKRERRYVERKQKAEILKADGGRQRRSRKDYSDVVPDLNNVNDNDVLSVTEKSCFFLR